MTAAMAGEKDEPHPVELAGKQGIGRLPEGSDDRFPLGMRQPFDIVNPAAADDAEARAS
jgi:hypothetical protein